MFWMYSLIAISKYMPSRYISITVCNDNQVFSFCCCNSSHCEESIVLYIYIHTYVYICIHNFKRWLTKTKCPLPPPPLCPSPPCSHFSYSVLHITVPVSAAIGRLYHDRATLLPHHPQHPPLRVINHPRETGDLVGITAQRRRPTIQVINAMKGPCS